MQTQNFDTIDSKTAGEAHKSGEQSVADRAQSRFLYLETIAAGINTRI